MKTFQIASVPMMELTQEAYEHMVTTLTALLPHEYNAKARELIIEKRQKAIEMAEHVRDLIIENKKDS